MEQKQTDNLTRSANAPAGPEKAEVPRRSAAKVHESINSEKLAAAGRLAAWLAHQINNPLGTISGSAQLLARRLERDIGDHGQLQPYLSYLETVQNQVERCVQITSDLLDFTRPHDIDLRSVDVMQAVGEAVDLAYYGRRQDSVVVRKHRNHDLPKVRTDKDLLVRVLYEVIANALYVAGTDGILTVDVSVASRSKGRSDLLRITVRDNGPGIPEDVLPRVFDPFFSTREKARGLGLTTSLAIMRQLGGSIEVSETGPSGTVMAITLPTKGPTR